MISNLSLELSALYLACLLYAAFSLIALSQRLGSRYRLLALTLATFGLISHSISIGARWIRVDHGPFINLYEILSSNLWSNMLGLTLFFLLLPAAGIVLRLALPVVLLLMAWLLVTPGPDGHLPPTYNTPWLYFHVFSGKIFFTLLLLASGSALHALLLGRTPGDPDAPAFSELAHRLLAFAFVAESLMLFFGAIWAQDAWGRYWSWDPLETWAFATWLVVIFTLHSQVDSRKGRLFLVLIPICLTLAFLTFFGVPFISTSAHQGAI
jgi:ABC-type transport system involved in cytochrome c biogenesis permease subunit